MFLFLQEKKENLGFGVSGGVILVYYSLAGGAQQLFQPSEDRGSPHPAGERRGYQRRKGYSEVEVPLEEDEKSQRTHVPHSHGWGRLFYFSTGRKNEEEDYPATEPAGLSGLQTEETLLFS